MKNIPGTTLFLLVLSVFVAQSAQPADIDTCIAVGGNRAPAEIRIYDENSQGENGTVLYSGRITRGQRIPLTVTSKRFRYEYRISADDSWSPSTGEWCQRGENKTVP